MFEKLEGNIIYKNNNLIFVENDYKLKQLYIDNAHNYFLNQKYKFYIFAHVVIGNKSIEKRINFAFDNLQDAIKFEELIDIDGVGVKTALKIIRLGFQKFCAYVNLEDIHNLSKKYSISTNVANNIIQFFSKKEKNNYSPIELKKINTAIANLQKLGYSKQLSTKIAWNRKDEIIKDDFVTVFKTLIEDIKNERINS